MHINLTIAAGQTGQLGTQVLEPRKAYSAHSYPDTEFMASSVFMMLVAKSFPLYT